MLGVDLSVPSHPRIVSHCLHSAHIYPGIKFETSRIRNTTMETGEMKPPTDYGAYVLDALASMTRHSGAVDQTSLRQCLGMASSYLVTDVTMNPNGGMASWNTGFARLVDVLIALHARGELELETLNAASKACSECWTVAGNWRTMLDCREGVRRVAGKLQKLLDENGRTYKGGAVYVP
ncbi:hypothetical protein BV25DRAFT_1844661 [Artomyces pyxidatus]|uniref:Uncharacterized protein n=1 Tax=Artomyces pyxidatus TaxID=48021 RepID=A0ACB8TK82_9AGAM|nr:hypothetical protein BV25DRAFT_1844661 [Artomyces pyxidatus]